MSLAGRSALVIALALSACKGQVVEQGVLVTVDNKSGATGIVQLRAVVFNLDRSEALLLPEVARSTPVDFPTQFSVSVPSTRSGRLDIAIEGLDSFGVPVASGVGFAILQDNAFVGATVDLLPIVIPPATGGAGGPAGTGGAVGAGGTTGAGGAPPVLGGALGAGGVVSAGGIVDTGGRAGAGGMVGAGGLSGTGATPSRGGVVGAGGIPDTGGAVGTGGIVSIGGTVGLGGRAGTGGVVGTVQTGGATSAAGATGTGGTGAGGSTGTAGACTVSINTGKSGSGTGPHKVVIESNSDSGISCGTIYRPADLGGVEKYPIFVWGEGGCSRNGLSNQASMAEIASWGYFVVADGPPGSDANCTSIAMSADVVSMAKPLIGYIDWAITENGKPCSAYYDSLDTTKVASDGFSCGGLMAMGVAGDPRTTAFGYTSSGLTSVVASYYQTIHTPVKILLGGSGDVAYTNGERDYDNISALGIPVLLLSKDGAGHGGDLINAKGDFNTVNLAWLNWRLKGDEGATGKGLLVGPSCKYCNASGWEFKSANIE
jgi:hypothetical protein